MSLPEGARLPITSERDRVGYWPKVEYRRSTELLAFSKVHLATILVVFTGHCPIDIDIHTARLKIQSVPFSIILLQLYFVTNLLFTSVFAAAQTM